MYDLADMARFALAEFERGLGGLTDEEARTELEKADGTRMNAISWTAGHLAWHWHATRRMAMGESIPKDLWGYATGTTEPAPPPSLEETHALLARAREAVAWIDGADHATLGTVYEKNNFGENNGTAVMRVILHTWFHAGEVNAVRQMLGHPEIRFVGDMVGQLEWKPASEVAR